VFQVIRVKIRPKAIAESAIQTISTIQMTLLSSGFPPRVLAMNTQPLVIQKPADAQIANTTPKAISATSAPKATMEMRKKAARIRV
jgi:hypothetical protein